MKRMRSQIVTSKIEDDIRTMAWKTTTIGEQVTLQRGIDITKAQQRAGAVPVVSSGGISSYHDTAYAAGPGVVLGRKGTIGTVFYVEGPYWPHDTTLWVKDFKNNDPRFVYYFFLSMQSVLMALDVGTANPALNRNHVHPIKVKWPPFQEQKAISSALGAIDDKIELNRKMNRTLEATAHALFKSWFIDFDPVAAKAAGEEWHRFSKPILDLLPCKFSESKLGPIPHGWKLLTFDEVFEVNPPRELRRGQLSPYLEMQNLPTNSALPEHWRIRELTSGMKFMNGDTLVARITPCLENGKTAYVMFLEEGEVGWGSTEYLVIRSRTALPLEFSYFVARSDEFRTHAIANMTGSSGRQRVPATSLNSIVVAVPPPEIANAFGTYARRIFSLLKANLDQTSSLRVLRDSLIPRLMSGMIRFLEDESVVLDTLNQ